MHAILFSLPGSPVLYYGDEIAMGDNVYLGDRQRALRCSGRATVTAPAAPTSPSSTRPR